MSTTGADATVASGFAAHAGVRQAAPDAAARPTHRLGERHTRRAAVLRREARDRSGIRRLRPGVAFAFTLTLAGAALIVTNPLQSAVLLVLIVAALATSRLLRASWPYVRISLYIAAVVLVVNPLFGAGGLDVLWSWDLGLFEISITIQGIVFGISSALRLAGVILAFSLLNLAVDPDDQLALMSRLSFRSGLVLSLASRLLPVFSRDATRITDAQRARGVPLDQGRRRDRAAARLPLLACMLTQSLERTVDVAASMESRGYGAGRRTLWVRRRRWAAADVIALAATGAVVAALVAGVVAGAWSYTFFPLLEDPWTAMPAPVWLAVLAGLLIPLIVTSPWRRSRS